MKKTLRGFNIYGSLTDSRKNKLRVQESSEIGPPRVWLFAQNKDGNDAIIHLGKPMSISPYLSKAQAKRLADMLMRLVNDEA